MSAFTLLFTDAGRAALINAAQTGTEKRTVVSAGMTNTPFTATATMTSIPGEIKRIDAVSGAAIAPDQISLGILDTGTDTYTVTGFGLYLDNDVLLAVYSQETPLLVKTQSSFTHLQVDVLIKDASIQAEDIKFGDMVFLNPVATETMEGVARIATQDEVYTGTDDKAILTPKKLSATLTSRLATAEDIQNGTAGKLVDAALLVASNKTLKVNTKTFTSSGIYTPSQNTVSAIVEVLGAGGGGGNAPAANGIASVGGGGGAGGYCKKVYSASALTEGVSVTVGAGGAAQTAGGTSKFDTLIANGGGAGTQGIAGVSGGATGAAGGSASGGDINVHGFNGGLGWWPNSVIGTSGAGGDSFYGRGGSPRLLAANNSQAGIATNAFGAGGSGGAASGSQPYAPGGEGGNGIVIITEYILE